MAKKSVQIIPVGGGKGGAGKSVVSANLAICLAQAGRRVVAVDVDLGGANLHTLFGLRTTDRGVGDFLYAQKSRELADFAIETGIPNLWFISGNGFIPGIANLEYQRKLKLLKALTKLDYDYVILDLGAGTSYNVIDFFAITQSAIIVTLPEPTAVLNAYEFLKNAVFRILTRRFGRKKQVLNIINAFKTAPDKVKGDTLSTLADLVKETDEAAGQQIREIAASFRPALIINQNPTTTCILGDSLVDICRNYLDVSLYYLGSIPYDEAVQKASLRMKPFVLDWPASEPSKAIRVITQKCLSTTWMDLSLVSPTAAPREKAEEDEERPEEDEDEDRVSIRTILEGHSDSELSALLGTFLTTSFTVLQTDVAREKSATQPAGAPAPEPVHEPEQAPLSVELFLEPRLPSDARTPFFSPLPEQNGDRQPGTGFFKRLSRKQRYEAQVVKALSKIPKSSGAENMSVTIKLLTSNAPHTPRVGQEWLKAGLAFVEAQQISLAKQSFSNAMVCLPGNDIAVHNWAASQILTDATESLVTVLSNEVTNNPESGFLRYDLGLVQLSMGQFAMAADSFKKVRRLLSDESPEYAQFLEAYCRYQNQEYPAATEIFTELVEQNHEHARLAWYNSALCLYHTGHYDQAIEVFTKILENSPNDVDSVSGRAIAAWRAHRAEEAVTDLTRAIHLDPGNLALRQARGTICYQIGRLDIAIRDIQTITQLVPTNEAFQHLLLKIRQELQ
ncbi:MAG: tetratricopeptide repeat protein [Kiritimatiellae bacterium]|nr:tetratricopeptide repeat protein [Kiritimatiellia bacterium]